MNKQQQIARSRARLRKFAQQNAPEQVALLEIRNLMRLEQPDPKTAVQLKHAA